MLRAKTPEVKLENSLEKLPSPKDIAPYQHNKTIVENQAEAISKTPQPISKRHIDRSPLAQIMNKIGLQIG